MAAAAPAPEGPAGFDDTDSLLGAIRDIRAEIVRLDGVLRREELEPVRPPDAAMLAARVDAVSRAAAR